MPKVSGKTKQLFRLSLSPSSVPDTNKYNCRYSERLTADLKNTEGIWDLIPVHKAMPALASRES